MPIHRTRIALLLACALAAGAPLTAQSPRADGGVDARMRAFVQVARERRAAEEIAAFFPRRGVFTWTLATRRAGQRALGRWRFEPADLVPAMDDPGPLCETFSHGGDVIVVGTLMYRIITDPRSRRVSRTRFVPPGESTRSATYLEWRREDGRWVVAEIGEERDRGESEWPWRMVRDSVPADPLTLPLAAGAPLAGGTRWYQEHEPIQVHDYLLSKYGLPRPIGEGEVRRIGSIEGVGVYVETGTGGSEVVYVPVSADGLFQPYQGMTGTGCA